MRVPVGGGLPPRIAGIADTVCISTKGAVVAIADKEGNLYVSADTAPPGRVTPTVFHLPVASWSSESGPEFSSDDS